MDWDYGLFVLNRERKVLENKIEGILDGVYHTGFPEERKSSVLRMYKEQLSSVNYAIKQLELNKLRD